MNSTYIILAKFGYTLAVIFILSRYIYYPNKGKSEYLFTFILMSTTIYFICLLVQRAELTLGFALGIFAVFGIIRYRTAPIYPREMTYIFMCAGIAAKNSLLSYDYQSFDRVLISDIILLLLAGLLEYFLLRGKSLINKKIVFNQLDLIHPDKRVELMQELDNSFGIKDIKKIKVGKINVSQNTANLNVSFLDKNDDHIPDSGD
jgi:hypothetical protein